MGPAWNFYAHDTNSEATVFFAHTGLGFIQSWHKGCSPEQIAAFNEAKAVLEQDARERQQAKEILAAAGLYDSVQPEVGWGGKREGAGRKPELGEPAVSKTVYLPVSVIAFLEKTGDGNLSAGIRRIADERMQRT